MAVDSKADRASATALLVPSMAPYIMPDGSIAQADKQAAAWCYGGVLAATVSAYSTEITANVEMLEAASVDIEMIESVSPSVEMLESVTSNEEM